VMAHMSRKEFLTELRGLLRGLSREEVEERLLAWARGLRAEERAVFLDRFRGPKRRRTKPSGKALLREVEAFEARMRAYEYTNGWGWDPEIRAERAWGDEGWAVEIDGFLDGARQLYEAGAYADARDVYAAVFRAYDGGLEEGLLAGADPEALVEANLDEECARYLRCVYLAAEPSARPEELMTAWDDPFVRYAAQNLRAMLEVDDAELPGWEAFGRDWIACLETMDRSAPVTEWIGEAVRLFRGSEGLEELARSRGRRHPSHFIEWVDALRAEGCTAEAVEAAVLALDTVPDGLAIRASLAERLVVCARKAGKAAEVDRGLREALWAEPTLARLVAFIERGDTFADRQERLARAAERFAELDRTVDQEAQAYDSEVRKGTMLDRLWPCVHLLAGDYEVLARFARETEPRRPTRDPGLARMATCFLLYACRGSATERLPENLGQEWTNAVQMTNAYWFDGRDPGCGLFEGEEGKDEPGLDVMERFTRLVREAVAGADVSGSDLRRWFGSAEGAALKRVDTIVSTKERGSYDRAARLLTAVAEVYWTWGEGDEGRRLLDRYWNKYSRFSAFRRELRAAAGRSPPMALT